MGEGKRAWPFHNFLRSTHNFISHELEIKLGLDEFEMGDFILVDGAFKGQEVSIIPLIGKLQLHVTNISFQPPKCISLPFLIN